MQGSLGGDVFLESRENPGSYYGQNGVSEVESIRDKNHQGTRGNRYEGNKETL